ALPLEIVVESMEPFMRERTGAASLGQVDNDPVGLVVSRCPSPAARAKTDTKRTLETHRPWRKTEQIGKIHEGVIGFVQKTLALVLAPALSHPVSELNAAESERVD